ncbi:MAG: transporter [Bacteroidaceae bacterium]|nr:transporter [Bacteroidaceae bacterium]
MKLIRFLKNWALVIAITLGVVSYFVFVALPLSPEVHAATNRIVSIVQPTLIFMMLFLSFCKIRPSDLKLCRWHLWLLLLQALLFISLCTVLLLLPDTPWKILIESTMLCLICPTATAAAVIVGKLGGNVAHLVTYTVLINLTVSVLVPLLVPVIHPQPGITFLSAFTAIIAKVFPLLICPLLLAWLLRYAWPKLNERLQHTGDLAFYLWAVSLCIAIAVSTRSIVHSTAGIAVLVGIAVASFLCCIFQFWAGKRIGSRYDRNNLPDIPSERTTAGQALGQKNTVFLIWLSYTFFTPVTAIAGGFYSIWHNVYNSWQLYRQRNTHD